MGDGTVNVGVGLLSTFSGWKSINTSVLMDAFVDDRAGALGHLARDVVRRAHRRQAADRRVGRRRTSGPRGSSSATPPGSVNPFNGEGISLAYETGRMAASAVSDALTTGDGLALTQLPAAARGDVRPLLEGGAARSCGPSATRR